MYSPILAITLAWSKVKDQLGVPRKHLVVPIRSKLSNQAKLGQLDGCIKIIRGPNWHLNCFAPVHEL